MTAVEFFAGLRAKGSHLGLEPEFSSIELLATVEPAGRPNVLRENIDLFFWGRSKQILTQIHRWATEQGVADAAYVLEQIRGAAGELLTGPFQTVPENQQLPQPALLREMLNIVSESGSAVLDRYIADHVADLDGNFYMVLSESLRNMRKRGERMTFDVLVTIGGLVAYRRREAGLPCVFANLYLR